MTKACVLEEGSLKLNMREIDIEEPFTSRDVRIDIKSVGICGSDVHYYQHGNIGPFVVNAPMVLGHEAAGVVTEVGSEITHLKIGDRVCMEPGIPNPFSEQTRSGMYNVDPDVRFWATPPYAPKLLEDKAWANGHGCLRPSVVHPADFTFKIPDHISFDEGAMVEPLAVGMHACSKAQIKPGDLGMVIGAGPIGILTALTALASGCAKVFVADTIKEKLEVAERLKPGQIVGICVDPSDENSMTKQVNEHTNQKGVQVVFECSGNPYAAAEAPNVCSPGGTLVWVGCPVPFLMDIGPMLVRELRTESIFRYAHMYPKSISMLASGSIDVKPIITDYYNFDDSVEGFDYMCNPSPSSIKSIIRVADE